MRWAGLGRTAPGCWRMTPTPCRRTPRTCFAALLTRRAAGEPLAYLTGQREFFGLNLAVDARVPDSLPRY